MLANSMYYRMPFALLYKIILSVSWFAALCVHVTTRVQVLPDSEADEEELPPSEHDTETELVSSNASRSNASTELEVTLCYMSLCPVLILCLIGI